VKNIFILILGFCIFFLLTACGNSLQEIPAPPVPAVVAPDTEVALGNCNAEEGALSDEAFDEWCDCGETLREVVVHSSPPLCLLPFSFFGDGKFISEVVGSFDAVHEFAYLQWEADWHHSLIIWADATVRDLSFVSLGFNDRVEQPYFFVLETLRTIDVLSPGDAIVFNVAFSHYLIPHVGLAFTDENGVYRRMYIAENMDSENPCVCFHRFVLLPHEESASTIWAWFAGWDWD